MLDSEPVEKYTAQWYDDMRQIRDERDDCDRCDDRGFVTINADQLVSTDWRCHHTAEDFEARTAAYLSR